VIIFIDHKLLAASPCGRIVPLAFFARSGKQFHMAEFDPRALASIRIPNCLLPRNELSPGAKLAYGRLAARLRPYRSRVTLHQKYLALDLGVTDRMIRKYLIELVTWKLIKIDRPDPRAGNRYSFLQHPWMRKRLLSDRKDYSVEEQEQ
jgi:hypothetical protein